MKKESLLIEIGTEELPPKSLQALSTAFTDSVTEQLKSEGFTFREALAYATPRRLAICITELIEQQPTQDIERRGPALKAAYDQQGNPSKAALGFAKSCGIEMEQLEKIETTKGAWLYFKSSQAGKSLQEIIAIIIESALQSLPIAKPMRWGDNEVEFVRPIHWVVLMYGKETIEACIKSLNTSNTTYGHRFHAPQAIRIEHPDDYVSLLEQANVIAGFDQRKAKIKKLIDICADEYNAVLKYEDSLLNEVTNLVEWPTAIVGEFSKTYLEIPQEVLVATMQGDQRYFPLYSKADNKLLANFITIANIDSTNPETIKRGNERVIKPRFEDAGFFWNRDCDTKLADRSAALANILFEKQLGTILDKTKRIEKLAKELAQVLEIDSTAAERAAHLCKCDLTSLMVNEFPKLQGVMGRYYASNDGEPEEVAIAIEEHYQPLQSGAKLPDTNAGKLVAISDRVDSLIGIFATGKKPTGVKDPYALRRAALGIIRITLESEQEFGLYKLLTYSASLFNDSLHANNVVAEVYDFIIERLRGYLQDQGIEPDVFEATHSVSPKSLLDFKLRIQAVDHFRKSVHAVALAAANKRIRNILKNQKTQQLPAVNHALLNAPEEIDLDKQLERIKALVAPKISQRNYKDALTDMSELKTVIDDFFDHIMVMDEDESIRNNRIALLAKVSELFSSVADISQLQS